MSLTVIEICIIQHKRASSILFGMTSRFEELFDQPLEEFHGDRKKKVGGYILEKTIGHGCFAKVRTGVHALSKEKVAVKVITKKLLARRKYVKRNMRREAAMLQRLQHPNIIQLLEVLETDNSYYIVTELVDGGEFSDYLKYRVSLSEHEARKYVRQIVSAVDHMHRSGIIHRDIKLENLLLNKNMDIKMIDFGLSNSIETGRLLHTQCGSPAYTAPEIFSNKSYGTAVDIWSIGVNMFAMVTGSLPFTVDPPNNLSKLYGAIVRGCKVPSHISAEGKDLLPRMLEMNETNRITMPDLIGHPWLNTGYPFLMRAPLKSRMAYEDLNMHVVKYMAHKHFYSELDVRESVVAHKCNAMAATYQLLLKRVGKKKGLPDHYSKEMPMQQNSSQLDDAKTFPPLSMPSMQHTYVEKVAERTHHVKLPQEDEPADSETSSLCKMESSLTKDRTMYESRERIDSQITGTDDIKSKTSNDSNGLLKETLHESKISRALENISQDPSPSYKQCLVEMEQNKVQFENGEKKEKVKQTTLKSDSNLSGRFIDVFKQQPTPKPKKAKAARKGVRFTVRLRSESEEQARRLMTLMQIKDENDVRENAIDIVKMANADIGETALSIGAILPPPPPSSPSNERKALECVIPCGAPEEYGDSDTSSMSTTSSTMFTTSPNKANHENCFETFAHKQYKFESPYGRLDQTFLDRYRFKVRTAAGDRVTATNSTIPLLTLNGGLNKRSKTLPENILAKVRPKDPVNLATLGAFYSVPDYTSTINKRSPLNKADDKTLGATISLNKAKDSRTLLAEHLERIATLSKKAHAITSQSSSLSEPPGALPTLVKTPR